MSSFELGPDLKRLVLAVRISSLGLMGAQLFCVGLGYVIFPQPAIEHYLEAVPDVGHTHKTRFEVCHAVFMWLAIPQHVPTTLATIALFFFVTALHILDVERMIVVAADTDAELVDEHSTDHMGMDPIAVEVE